MSSKAHTRSRQGTTTEKGYLPDLADEFSDDEDLQIDASTLNKKFISYRTGLRNTSQVDEPVKGTSYAEESGDDGDELNDNDDDDDEIELVQNATKRTPSYDYWTLFWKFIFRSIHKIRQRLSLVMTFTLLILVNLLIILLIYSRSNATNEIIPNVHSFTDISKNLQNLQWQINDSNQRNKLRLQDFKNFMDLKLEEFGTKFKKIDNEIDSLKRDNDAILQKIESLNFEGAQIDDNKIPVLLDPFNNIKVLPEFERYLKDFIQSSLNGEIFTQHFKVDYETLVENYLDEVIHSKIGFLNKEEILSLITAQFQENKKKLISEIKALTQRQEEKVIPSRLISESYNKPAESKINYSLFSSGARIINYLTSSTFKPKYKTTFIGSLLDSFSFSKKDVTDDSEPYTTSPFIILTSNEGYWRSADVNDTRLAIKFLEPIYLTDFKYIHERSQNGALLTSAPKTISLYINTQQSVETPYRDVIKNHYKVAEFTYDINGPVEQQFTLPKQVKKYLINSILIQMNDNYGNEFFTSLYKFKIHGLTKFDLHSIKQLLNNDEIDESLKRRFGTMGSFGVKEIKGIKDFRDDTIV